MKKDPETPNTVILTSGEVSKAIQMFLDSKGIDYDPEVICWHLPKGIALSNDLFNDCNIHCILRFHV